MPHTYSEQILLALDKHGRLNCRQLANQISHKLDNTTAIVSYMRGNKKIRLADEKVDDLAAYELDELGRRAVAAMKGEGTPAPVREKPSAMPPQEPPSSRAAASLDDLAEREMKQTLVEATPPVEPTSAPAETIIDRAIGADVRMGILNTGELLIWPVDRSPILLEAVYVNSLRTLLGVGVSL